MRALDPDAFYRFFRMTVDCFDWLLEVEPFLRKRSNRKSVSPGEHLAITLRFVMSRDIVSALRLKDKSLTVTYTSLIFLFSLFLLKVLGISRQPVLIVLPVPAVQPSNIQYCDRNKFRHLVYLEANSI